MTLKKQYFYIKNNWYLFLPAVWIGRGELCRTWACICRTNCCARPAGVVLPTCGRFCCWWFCVRFIGRILTPDGSDGMVCIAGFRSCLGGGGRPLPTGGCILLSMTVYFCSLLAENERVVPIFTLNIYRNGNEE